MADKNLFIGSGPRDPNIGRSKYDFSFTNHLTGKFGLIYPCFLQECNPNESLVIKPHATFDLMPMVFPLQSTITMHMSFYKCAFRNLWTNYKDFESGVGNHIFPYVSNTNYWHYTGSLADYMGLPSYQNRPILNWTNVKGFQSSDLNLSAYRRCFRRIHVDESIDPITGNSRFGVHHFNVDGVSYDAYYSDQLTDFFSVSNDENSNAVQLSDIVNGLISVDQPYMKFRIISLSQTAPSVPDLTVGFISYAKTGNIRTNGIRSTYYYRFFGSDYQVSSVQTDLSAIGVGKAALLHSKQLTFNNQGICYEHTFALYFKKDFVAFFNYLHSNGFANRIVIEWPDNKANGDILGYNNVTLQTGMALISSNSIGTSQATGISNGHISFTSSDYRLANNGLQLDISVRTQTSGNSKVLDSPFVRKTGSNPVLPVSVLPFRMYEFIYNLYFRNTFVDPFIKDGQPTYNKYLTNDGDGADGTTPLDFKHCLYETDYFTTAQFTPQAGNAPLVGISHTEGAADAVFHFVDENDQPVNLRVATDSTGVLTGISEYSTNANESTLKNLNALINYGISINDFRSVAAFQRFLERKQRAGFDYRSIVKEFFGTTPPVGEEFPEYLGGMSKPVSIFKIENQAETDLPLGSFAGTARVQDGLGDKDAIRVFCSERSYVMGLVWFSVTPVYPQSLPKHWTKREYLDFFNPQFAAIGNQPVHNYEIAPLQATDNDNLMSVFGYQRPWYDYVMKTDEVHGQFRDTQHNYLIQREFATIPELGHDFISVENDDLTNVFSLTQGTDKIFGAIRFDCMSNSPVPRFIQPSIVG